MKKSLVVVVLSLSFAAMLSADGDTGYKAEARGNSEIFSSKVLKVLSFQEGDGEYVAYLVTWKDHEVVVVPYGLMPGDKRADVGDTIKCQMQQLPHRVGDANKSHMVFSVLPAIVAGDESKRLDAVAAEVHARRLKRSEQVAPPQDKAP